MRSLLVVTIVSFLVFLVAADTLGDRFLHTALSYGVFPVSALEARASGAWVKAGGCIPGRGVPFTDLKGVSKSAPIILYFQEAYGFLSGFTIRRWDASKPNSGADMYWESPKVNITCAAGTCSDLTAIFRDPMSVCGNGTSMEVQPKGVPYTVGDRILVGSKLFNVPLNKTVAQRAGWSEGNCIGHMGIHHSYMFDWESKRASNGGPWTASTLFPIQPMYDATTGHINAILVNNPHASIHVFPIGWWEGPFINYLFCKNWCKDSGCGFSDTNTWTTMHFFFRDPKGISCTGARCTL